MGRELAVFEQCSAEDMRIILIFMLVVSCSCKQQRASIPPKVTHEGLNFGSDSQLNWGWGSGKLQYLVIREGPVEKNPYFRIRKGIPVFKNSEEEILLNQTGGINLVVLGKKQFHGNIDMPLEKFDQWLHKKSAERKFPEDPFFDLVSWVSTTTSNVKIVIQTETKQ